MAYTFGNISRDGLSLDIIRPTNISRNEGQMAQKAWPSDNAPASTYYGKGGFANLLNCMEIDWGNAKGDTRVPDISDLSTSSGSLKNIKSSFDVLRILFWCYNSIKSKTDEYIVEFINDGQIIGITTGPTGTLVNRPTTPSKDGYTFAGWSKTNGSNTVENVISTIGKKHVFYYAVWTRNLAKTIKINTNAILNGDTYYVNYGSNMLLTAIAQNGATASATSWFISDGAEYGRLSTDVGFECQLTTVQNSGYTEITLPTNPVQKVSTNNPVLVKGTPQKFKVNASPAVYYELFDEKNIIVDISNDTAEAFINKPINVTLNAKAKKGKNAEISYGWYLTYNPDSMYEIVSGANTQEVTIQIKSNYNGNYRNTSCGVKCEVIWSDVMNNTKTAEVGYSFSARQAESETRNIQISATLSNITYNGTTQLTASYDDGTDINESGLTWSINSTDSNYINFQGSYTGVKTVNLKATNDNNPQTFHDDAKIDNASDHLSSPIAYNDATGYIDLIIHPAYTRQFTSDQSVTISCTDGNGNVGTKIIHIGAYNNYNYDMNSATPQASEYMSPLRARCETSINEQNNTIKHHWIFVNENTTNSSKLINVSIGINKFNQIGVDKWTKSEQVECLPQQSTETKYLYIGTTKPTSLSEAEIVTSYPEKKEYTNNSGQKSNIFVLTNNNINVTFINNRINSPISQKPVDTSIDGYKIFETAVGTANTGKITIRFS